MKCDNCGKNNVNVMYTQVINGEKKELALCEECSKKLGIDKINFNMPIDFSSFFGDFLGEFDDEFIPALGVNSELKCNNCGLTFDEFMKTGKFGCPDCFDIFKDKIDPILKQIQGENRHIGRLGIVNNNTIIEKNENKNDIVKDESYKNQEDSEVEKLKKELNDAIKTEDYEKAAVLRDKIKELENKE